jgi:hypothetical protein
VALTKVNVELVIAAGYLRIERKRERPVGASETPQYFSAGLLNDVA